MNKYSNIGALFIILIIISLLFISVNKPDIRFYKHYINICKKLIKLNKEEELTINQKISI